jgi:hypothetical protein
MSDDNTPDATNILNSLLEMAQLFMAGYEQALRTPGTSIQHWNYLRARAENFLLNNYLEHQESIGLIRVNESAQLQAIQLQVTQQAGFDNRESPAALAIMKHQNHVLAKLAMQLHPEMTTDIQTLQGTLQNIERGRT